MDGWRRLDITVRSIFTCWAGEPRADLRLFAISGIEGQGSGERIDKKPGEAEVEYDAMGNKVDGSKKKKMTATEARKVRIFGAALSHDERSADDDDGAIGEEGPYGTPKARRGGESQALSGRGWCYWLVFFDVFLKVFTDEE
jgi:hypothetical protein